MTTLRCSCASIIDVRNSDSRNAVGDEALALSVHSFICCYGCFLHQGNAKINSLSVDARVGDFTIRVFSLSLSLTLSDIFNRTLPYEKYLVLLSEGGEHYYSLSSGGTHFFNVSCPIVGSGRCLNN